MSRGNIIAILLALCVIASIMPGASPVERHAAQGPVILHAQELPVKHPAPGPTSPETDSGSTIYLVMGVVLAIWLALGAYLFRLDRKISRLEKDLHGGN